MPVLLLESRNIKKSFADRVLLDIPLLTIYAGDKIGFVGANGSGKTTLLDILSGRTEPDGGSINRYGGIAYIRQFSGGFSLADAAADFDEAVNAAEENLPRRLSLYGVRDKADSANVSGGEASRLRIAGAISEYARLIFADEPTSNLDMDGIALFGEELRRLESFILISHDRTLLNKYCNRIMTLENHNTVFYEGNYDAYRIQSEAKKERALVEYEQYSIEKERLQKVYADKKSKAVKATKKPKGMSSSEIKQRDFIATSRSNDGRQRGFERAARAVQARIDQMDVKERPAEPPRIKLDFSQTDPPVNKIVISGKDIHFSYGGNVIFDGADFEARRASRVALAGPNGCGKTTLLNMIKERAAGIYTVPKARIGYFYQGFEQLNPAETILQNAMEGSVQKENVVRSVLARLLFARDDVGKPVGALSGGERIKLSFAKLLVSGCNVLMLDEPTNYLDMPSMEVLQAILCEYEGTLLFVSHDRAFVNAVATDLLIVKEKKLHSFRGNLDMYDSKTGKDTNQMILEHRLAAISGEISRAGGSQKEQLVKKYEEVSAKLAETSV